MPALTPHAALRGLWHRVPATVRAHPVVRRLSRAASAVLIRDADLYTPEYYAFVEHVATKSAPHIAATIVRDLNPRTVVDIGCGTGVLLQALRERGVAGRGYEYAATAREYCRARGLDVVPCDFGRGPVPTPTRQVDVAVSTEVAEHVPAAMAEVLVDSLANQQARVVVFTAATPGQGGVGHINEQPHAYWLEKFARRYYRLDAELTAAWRAEWKVTMQFPWYADNVMVLRREG